MKTQFNEHLNPRPYRYSAHVIFHIQDETKPADQTLCGHIYRKDQFNVFSANFVKNFHITNQCKTCIDQHELRQLPDLLTVGYCQIY